MTKPTRPQRERINTPENRRLIAEEAAHMAAAAVEEASRRQPEGR